MRISPVSRFVVNDKSMEPGYCSGDYVLTFNWIRVKRNDVIVFKYMSRYLIKRVDRIESENISVSGDNKKLSVKVKPIAPRQVVGRVLLKY